MFHTVFKLEKLEEFGNLSCLWVSRWVRPIFPLTQLIGFKTREGSAVSTNASSLRKSYTSSRSVPTVGVQKQLDDAMGRRDRVCDPAL